MKQGEIEIELEDLPPRVVRKMLRALMAKKVGGESEDSEGEVDKSEEEREKLSQLHEEGKGESPKVEVDAEDLPEELTQGKAKKKAKAKKG